MQLAKPGCDTEKAFSDQKLLFTLPFCGNPPGNDQFWSQLSADGKNGPTCKSITGAASCIDYVAKNPQSIQKFLLRTQGYSNFRPRHPGPTFTRRQQPVVYLQLCDKPILERQQGWSVRRQRCTSTAICQRCLGVCHTKLGICPCYTSQFHESWQLQSISFIQRSNHPRFPLQFQL